MSLLILLGSISLTAPINSLFHVWVVFVVVFRIQCPWFDKVLLSSKSQSLSQNLIWLCIIKCFVFYFLLTPHACQKLVVAMPWPSTDILFLFYPRHPFAESNKTLLPQIDLTGGAELLWSDLKILVRECCECYKDTLSGRHYFCVLVDRIPDMNVLSSFTRAQHIAPGMPLPFLLCFPMGTALQTAQHSLGASCSTCPNTGHCQGERGAGVQHQLLLPVCSRCMEQRGGGKGSLAQQHWLSLCPLSFLLPFLSRRV